MHRARHSVVSLRPVQRDDRHPVVALLDQHHLEVFLLQLRRPEHMRLLPVTRQPPACSAPDATTGATYLTRRLYRHTSGHDVLNIGNDCAAPLRNTTPALLR